MRKCETVLALSNLGAMLRSASSSRTTMHVEPLKPVNRLRVPPQSPLGGSTSRMCSRCSSLLSMASSSRYSLNTTGGFVQCGTTPPGETQTLLCKLCLVEVPVVSTCEILQCGCCFCKDCMKSYIEFEIQEGAYDISCPDAQCDKQGVISMSEIENLVSVELVEKHRKFRLNREVDLDVNRTWCPRAGCETVCSVCPTERCQPQSVHCPTCTSDFCSNCKNPWHPGLTCEENSQRLAKEGMPDNMEPGIPFDSDLIKCCPMCNVPIEKDEGCAQMMCKRCKHVFCWYCLASLDDDFLLRHYDKGPCKNKLGHSRASVIWHRTQVIGIFAGFGILLLVASPLLLLAAPCIVCCKCRICSGGSKLDSEDEMPEESAS
ncbi:Potential E3 ubiquitin-protein ligase ariadne-1 [Gryllus bimaculatus]|nr:Potential E3 ubiquitin-protein ligase ariadne-1 [Gryllus bimaculatus]